MVVVGVPAIPKSPPTALEQALGDSSWVSKPGRPVGLPGAEAQPVSSFL